MFWPNTNVIATCTHVPCVRKAKECIQAMKALQEECSLMEYICPCCNQFFEGEEWCHYILNCKTFKKERCKYIQSSINTPNDYTEGETGIKDITHWVYGYGHIPQFYPKSGEHGVELI
ncbi:hypothetical protein VP01_514g1 [Puccinia sorghi]|uniref:Uncharacterized protein n=1 Tax=Puccinia sorghi TaxID=27349 RepID=A0A0L6UKY4_9BASI|nr:hypothetical protein VP01_514g1 [Puccinia sorghi]